MMYYFTYLSSFTFADISSCEQHINQLVDLYVGILVHKTLRNKQVVLKHRSIINRNTNLYSAAYKAGQRR